MLLLSMIFGIVALLLVVLAFCGKEKTEEESNLGGLVFVDEGTFKMGSNNSNADEQPEHQVTLSHFYMGKFEISQLEWDTLMNPGQPVSGRADLPAENVSWYSALVYCNKRSIKEDLEPCYSIKGETNPALWGDIPQEDDTVWNAVACDWKAEGYRLPTEAEWEFAARGGINSKGYTYSGENDLNLVGWYRGNARGANSAIGILAANELGIYDMSGNVWEWCWDWYAEKYDDNPQTDPTGPLTGINRVARGGSWQSTMDKCRVTSRGSNCPGNVFIRCRGIRVSRTNVSGNMTPDPKTLQDGLLHKGSDETINAD